MTEQIPELVFINILLFTVIMLLLNKSFFQKNNVSKVNLTIANICIAFFVIFAFYDSDYFHYKEVVESNWEYAHLEDVYINIIDFTNRNYTLFRTIVWGGAFCIFVAAINKLRLKQDLATFIFVAVVITKFSYARISLGFAIILLGLAFLTYKNKFALLPSIFGLSLLYVSVFFHRSMVFGAVVAIAALLSTKVNKTVLVIIALVVIALSGIIKNLALETYMMEMLTEDDGTNRLELYLNAESAGSIGLGPMIKRILERAPYYLTALLFFMSVVKKINKKMPLYAKVTGVMVFYIVLLSSIFISSEGMNTDVIYYRFLYFAILPTIIFLTYLYSNNILPRLTKFTIKASLFGTIYLLVYSLYCSMT